MADGPLDLTKLEYRNTREKQAHDLLVRRGGVKIASEHRIAGARHIALERLTSEADSLDRDRPVLFYCRVGSRSNMAAQAFRRAGFDAYSMDGGLTEWDRRDFPLEPEDGTVADH